MLKSSWFFSNDVKRSAKLFLILALTPAWGLATELPPEVVLSPATAAGATEPVLIGDRITLQTIAGALPSAVDEIISLQPLDEKTRLEDLGWYLVRGTLNQNGILRFIASPLKTGDLTLPPLLITGAGGKALGRTAPLTIKVAGPTVKPDEKPDFVEVVAIKLPSRYWFFLGLLLILAVVLLRWVYLRYLKGKKRVETAYTPSAPPEPDHVVALRKLDDLFIRHPFTPEHLKIISFGVSEIIKEFFSKRFKIDALESTTDEMIMLLRREALSGEQLRAIQLLFQELDQFKFTKIEDFPPVYEETQSNLKIKATLIIQKWAPAQTGGESS